jgi:hypothetical protein
VLRLRMVGTLAAPAPIAACVYTQKPQSERGDRREDSLCASRGAAVSKQRKGNRNSRKWAGGRKCRAGLARCTCLRVLRDLRFPFLLPEPARNRHEGSRLGLAIRLDAANGCAAISALHKPPAPPPNPTSFAPSAPAPTPLERARPASAAAPHQLTRAECPTPVPSPSSQD